MVEDTRPSDTNPAETLHRAAELMRERAEAATQGPWRQVICEHYGPQASVHTPVSTLNISECANAGEYRGAENAAHIASWHPALAHAVAGFLQAIAARSCRQVTDFRYPNPEDIEWAEQIARAFLEAQREA